MKKRLFTIILSTLFLILVVTSASQRGFDIIAKEALYWDGSVASSFESGSGTENDPYLIKTPSQLAYLAKTVNSGNDYEGKYIKLISDIVMSDETFEFKIDSGLVKVTDGTNEVYIGTGINGQNSDVFGITASQSGKLYRYETSEQQSVYSGKINSFTPIGNVGFAFSGNFDGGHHSISGLYIKSSKDRIGLFGYANKANIKNLSIENSFVFGNSLVGTIVGEASFCVIENCHSGAVVCANDGVGGISGNLIDGEVCYSYNTGTVLGKSIAGGIVGINGGEIHNVYNSGNIYANENAGGIVGKNESSVKTSYNAGHVFAQKSVGAVSGSGSGSIINVYHITGSIATGSPGLTEAQMKNKGSFSGFDFSSTWEIGVSDNYSYPTLVTVKHKSVSHVYDNACDNICNSCGYVRDVGHNYETFWSRSEEYHFYRCTVCGDEGEKEAHIYDDACDSICNVCEYNRSVFHKYDTLWSFDKGSHWHECIYCGDKKDIEAHIPGKEATSTSPQICKVCQYVIKAPTGHVHSFNSSWKADTENHYKECSCGKKESVQPHSWNDGEITKSPSETEEGIKTFTCTVCSAEKTEKIDKLSSENDSPPSGDSDKDEDTVFEKHIEESAEEHKDKNLGVSLALGIASLGVSVINLILFAVIIIILLKNKNEKKA